LYRLASDTLIFCLLYISHLGKKFGLVFGKYLFCSLDYNGKQTKHDLTETNSAIAMGARAFWGTLSARFKVK